MSKHDNTENKVNGFPTAAALRKALAKVSKTDAMTRIRSLFDAKTFVELGAYIKRPGDVQPPIPPLPIGIHLVRAARSPGHRADGR